MTIAKKPAGSGVKQAEVAERAGVSQTLVSQVLRDRHTSKVKPETVRRIFQAAEELNYFAAAPRRTAAGQRNRTRTIALIMDPVYSTPRVAGYSVYDRLVTGVQSEVEKLAKTFVLGRPPQITRDYLLEIARKVDGILLKANISPSLAKELRAVKPIVMVMGSAPGADLPEVGEDGYYGIHQSTSYLIEHGHKNIVFIGADHDQAGTRERLRYYGYVQALAENNLIPVNTHRPSMQENHLDFDVIWRSILAATPRPTAIVCQGDGFAIPLIESAKNHSISLPKDFSIVGFDNSAGSAQTSPSLTTIDIPFHKIGALAVKRLMQAIETPNMPSDRIILGGTLIERSSVLPLHDETTKLLKRNSSSHRKAFTLIELLAVVAIISLLFALCMPTLNGYLTSVKSTESASNLKSLSQAARSFAADNDDHMPPTYYIDFAKSFGPGALTMPDYGITKKTLICPAQKPAVTPGNTSYGINPGISCALDGSYAGGSNFGTKSPLLSTQIMRPSRIILFADTKMTSPGACSYWASGPVTSGWGFGDTLAYRHKGKAHAIFMDGHMESIDRNHPQDYWTAGLPAWAKGTE